MKFFSPNDDTTNIGGKNGAREGSGEPAEKQILGLFLLERIFIWKMFFPLTHI